MSEEQDEPVQEIIGGADAAKASAALNALDRHDDDNEASNKTADAEALGKAMKDLDNQEVPAEKKKEASKKVKVDAADVALLVSGFSFFPSFFYSCGVCPGLHLLLDRCACWADVGIDRSASLRLPRSRLRRC